MALTEYRLGALAVVENVSDRDWINRKLRQLDPRLFVEKQLTFDDEEVWCVVEDTGEAWGEERHVCVYEFRDAAGRPIPVLTERIVHEMERRAREGTGNVLEARKIRRERVETRKRKMRERADEAYTDIATDFERHRGVGNFQIIPRSPQLARTRARVRTETVEQRRALDEARRIAQAFSRA